MKSIFFSICILFTIHITAQQLKPAEQLINKTDSAWPVVQDWIDNAKNHVEVLPADTVQAKDALQKIQVTTRSPMGAIIYSSGGILIDKGWIRILGSGNEKLNRTLQDWNKGKTITEFGQPTPYILIADDAIGGFFLLNGGGLGDDLGNVYYFAPDSLEYEPLGISYSGFLNFCFNGNLDEFYMGLRWKGWKKDIKVLNGDSVYSFYPYLWSEEGNNIENVSKKIVPIEEQYKVNCSFRKELGIN